MQFFTALVLCIAALHLRTGFAPTVQVEGRNIRVRGPEEGYSDLLRWQVPRPKRSSGYIISDCITVTSEEGKYYYKEYEGSNSVCGIYFLTDPDKIIEIYFDYVDVPCSSRGRISIVDGWELDGQYFPSLEDHQKRFEDRYYEFCGVKGLKKRKTMLTSQNAGLVQFRLPKRDNAFSFQVRFLKSNTPCNILNEGRSKVYTLRNYGRPLNCSFISVTPAKIKVLAMNVGIVGPSSIIEVETGSLHKCSQRGAKDLVQIGGNEGLDTSKMETAVDICGLDSIPQNDDVIIACNMTTVKLISSGDYDNSVTFMVSPVEEEDLMSTSLICGLQ